MHGRSRIENLIHFWLVLAISAAASGFLLTQLAQRLFDLPLLHPLLVPFKPREALFECVHLLELLYLIFVPLFAISSSHFSLLVLLGLRSRLLNIDRHGIT